MPATADNSHCPTTIHPRPIQPGEMVGLAPLAGPWQEDKLAQGIEVLTSLGFRVKKQPGQNHHISYLANSDQQRDAIFQKLYQDQEVKAVIACRGGYGTMRILPLLDFELFTHKPKPIIGFSDISALLNTITSRTGLITFHGPNVTTLPQSTNSSRQKLVELLTNYQPDPLSFKSFNLEIINPGRATGTLVGGNLTTLVHLLGTDFEPDWRDKIVILEDVGEAPYRIDRLLSQLSLAGKFKHIRAIMLGQFTNCGRVELIWSRLTELLPQGTPFWANLPIGHGPDNLPFPIGQSVEMDSNQQRINLLP